MLKKRISLLLIAALLVFATAGLAYAEDLDELIAAAQKKANWWFMQ